MYVCMYIQVSLFFQHTMAQSKYVDTAKKDQTKPRLKSRRGKAAVSCPSSGAPLGTRLVPKVWHRPVPSSQGP